MSTIVRFRGSFNSRRFKRLRGRGRGGGGGRSRSRVVMNLSQFYFAWVDVSETGFTSAHMREDELVFSFTLSQEEGDFATLEMDIRNPRIGLLAPGRPEWAWFSWSDGSNVYPLFHGRIVGVPSNLFAEVVTIKLIGKPVDYSEQRTALANSLKVLPYYDPLFIDEQHRDDPDTALEAYSALWHVDRVSGVVTISDLIVGEEGIDEFTPSDIFYDSVQVEIGSAPLVTVEMTADTSWTQTGGGSIDFGRHFILSWTGGIVGDWPKAGSDLSGGYRVVDSFAYEQVPSGEVAPYSYQWTNQEKEHLDGDALSLSVNRSGQGVPVKTTWSVVFGGVKEGQGAEMHIQQTLFGLRLFNIGAGLTIGMDMKQKRKETIKFSVSADLQPLMTDPDATSVKETVSLNAADVVELGVADGSIGSYWSTERGMQSLEYMLLVGRAHLLAKARAVKVTWECKFPRIIGMTCRKNASIEDTRLPGGITMGKVVSYKMTGDGDKGEFIGSVTINSAIGNGNAVQEVAGTPDYCEEGYVDRGYQHYSGTLQPITTGDLVWGPPAYPGTGLQNPLSRGQVVVRAVWHDNFNFVAGETAAQEAWRQAGQQASETPDTAKVDFSGTLPPELRNQRAEEQYQKDKMTASDTGKTVTNTEPSWLEIELVPLDGDVETELQIQLEPLVIPMQIDLSAPSS